MRLLLLITATGIVVACSSETRNVSEMGEPAEEKQDSISFQRPEMSGLTADVTKWVSIKLFKPAGGESVRQGFEVSGIASVFEATVNYRIYNSSGEILAESYTTATDGMNWGFFTFEPEFENQPEMGQDILLELYNINAKDGKEINDFRVPLIYTGN